MTKFNLTSVLLALPLLAACETFTPGHPAQREPLQAELDWSRQTAALSSAGETLPLSERIVDPQLRAFINLALARNPDLALARARIEEARALTASDLSRFRPRLGAGGSVTANRQSETGLLPAGQIPGFETQQVIYTAGFDASWELDLFGRRDLVEEVGAYTIHRERLALRSLQASLIADIVRAYIESDAARAELALIEIIVARQSDLVRAARLRRERGEASDLDVEQAEAELTVQTARRPHAAEAAALAELRLAILTGTPPSAFRLEVRSVDTAIFRHDDVLIGTTSEVLRRRPDVLDAELGYALAAASVDLQTIDRYPTVSLFASAASDTTDLTDLLDPASLAASLAGVIDWALLDGGHRVAQRDAVSARLEQAEARYRANVLRVIEEVEAAATSLSRLQAEMDQRVALAARRTRIAEMARLRYEGGTGDLMSVLEVERDLADAQIAVVQIGARLETQRIALEKALGLTLEPFDPAVAGTAVTVFP